MFTHHGTKVLKPIMVDSIVGMSRFSKVPTPIIEKEENITPVRSQRQIQKQNISEEVGQDNNDSFKSIGKSRPRPTLDEQNINRLEAAFNKSSFTSKYTVQSFFSNKSHSVKKFQNFVANKLIRKPLKKIQKLDRSQITMKQTFDLLNLKRSLDRLLPQTVAENIGQQYLSIGLNQFKNDYLRDVIQKKPEYNEYLRVYSGDDDYRTNKIQQVADDHGREDENNLNKVFSKQTNNKSFFEIVKKQKLIQEEAQDDQLKAYMEYYNSCGRDQSEAPINMNLIHFHNKIQYIFNKIVTIKQGKAIHKFLKMSKNRQDSQVREIVIDSCGMQDEILSEILNGAVDQIIEIDGKRRQFLFSFVYSNNSFGSKSLNQLVKLTPDLIELRLNNVNLGVQSSIMEELTEHLNEYQAAPYLMKCAFSNMVLNDERIIKNLTDFMNMKKHLQFFDISFSSVGPLGLCQICEQLAEMAKQIRDVNLSYNHLNFSKEGSEDYQNSCEALENFKNCIKKAKVLNHINLSGMSIIKPKVVEIVDVIVNAVLIMSIHLNDNGITRDPDYFNEIIQKFGLTINDIPWSRKDDFDNYMNFQKQPQEREVIIESKRKYINVSKRVQIYMRFKAPDTNNVANKLIPSRKISVADLDEEQRVEKVVNQKRNQLKEHLLLGKEFRNMQHMKAMNASKDKFGVGRQADDIQDQFTITRCINHPELIFNQRVDWDSQQNKRFFNVDQNLIWQFSKQTECLVCNRYQYTQIFYERGVLAQNKELIEIKDAPLLEELRYQYQKEKIIFKTETPLIMGSIINKARHQGMFERKLKMLRTPLYAILAICQCREFFPDQDNVIGLKHAIKLVLNKDSNQLMDQIGVNAKLKGWSHIISDMTLHNELTDVKCINRPDLSAYNVEAQQWFTFAGFFKPGYHQIIIYDPMLDRAFCKDFVVKLNQRDFVYPEYPIHIENFVENAVPSVWKPFIDDNPKILNDIFNLDIKSEQFNWLRLTSRVIKNPSDEKACLELLKHFMDMQSREDFTYTQKLLKANIELCFQLATNEDGVVGLRGAMQRAELMNFIIRMAQAWKNMDKTKSARSMISESFDFFVHVYLDPLLENSQILEIRKSIRAQKRVNDLLYRNKEGLQEVFQVSKKFDKTNSDGNKGFTVNSARNFIGYFVDRKVINVSPKQIDEYFIWSQMTVQNEFTKSRKYYHLVYVEWLEYICRICYDGFDSEHNMFYEPLVFRLQYFLKAIWNYMYTRKYWERGTPIYEFVEVDQLNFIEN